MGANIYRDFLAGIRDIIGDRASTYENKLIEARETALSEMTKEAATRGTNAVIGVDLDYEALGKGNGMLMVSASGTAVKVQ